MNCKWVWTYQGMCVTFACVRGGGSDSPTCICVYIYQSDCVTNNVGRAGSMADWLLVMNLWPLITSRSGRARRQVRHRRTTPAVTHYHHASVLALHFKHSGSQHLTHRSHFGDAPTVVAHAAQSGGFIFSVHLSVFLKTWYLREILSRRNNCEFLWFSYLLIWTR